MRQVKSSRYTKFLDRYASKELAPSTDSTSTPTLSDERVALEAQAIEYEKNRKEQASKFPTLAPSEPKKAFVQEVTDYENIKNKATIALKSKIADLVGKGGFELSVNEFRPTKTTKATVGDETYTDNALILFDASFAVPGPSGANKIAKFVVSYDVNSDENYTVANEFYDKNESEYVLTSDNLNKFLETKEIAVSANKDLPVVWYDPTVETYVPVNTVSATEKVAARLQAKGFKVEKEYIDACYDPHQFGRLCWLVKVPMARVAEFKKLAGMKDDEWFDRAGEDGRTSPVKEKDYKSGEAWADRALEKSGYDEKKYKDGKAWSERALQTGEAGNPYSSEMKMMVAGAKSVDSKKEEMVKNALGVDKTESIKDNIKKLENLLGL